MPLEVRSLAEWEAAGIKNLLSVIIPAHNEEGHVALCVKELIKTLGAAGVDHEILIVDDNSTDDTGRLIRELCREHAQVRYVSNAPPSGFGFAVRSGLALFRGDAAAIVMADGSDHTADVVRFYRKLQEGYDCVFGSRFIRGASVYDYPLPKLILNRVANLLIRTLFLIRYNDVTNAFKMYSRGAIAGLQPLMSSQFNLTIEMPLKCIVRGYKYAVLPNSWRNRQRGISKFKIREMGSCYLFILIYCLIEKILSRGDYAIADRATQLQVWPR
jgi:dolichol-phosphate mannosyltransferase